MRSDGKDKLMCKFQHLGITLISIFAILSGINEIVVGFTGNFLAVLSQNVMRRWRAARRQPEFAND
jgi:hypothetical protein